MAEKYPIDDLWKMLLADESWESDPAVMAGGRKKVISHFLQERHGFGHAVSSFISSSNGINPTRS